MKEISEQSTLGFIGIVDKMKEVMTYECENCTCSYSSSRGFANCEVCNREGCRSCLGNFTINDNMYLVTVHNNCFKDIESVKDTKVVVRKWFVE